MINLVREYSIASSYSATNYFRLLFCVFFFSSFVPLEKCQGKGIYNFLVFKRVLQCFLSHNRDFKTLKNCLAVFLSNPSLLGL